MKKIKETICFTKNGIDVYVKIDYVNNQIDLVEKVPHTNNKFKMKNWNFVNRGVEYIGGWINILDAMKYAMEEAKKMYEHNLAEVSKFKKGDVEKILKSVEETRLEAIVGREYKRIKS